ncbi:MAG TPA: hypothetical protein VEU62_19695 [Bryobacterales bacterium]|nr:hypothetical protein [Bryobacterales bacterium]
MPHRCTEPDRLAAWCAAIAGDDLEARRSELFWQYLSGRSEGAVAAEIGKHVAACDDCRRALEQEQALLAARSGRTTILALCPSSEELLEYAERDEALSPFRRLEIRRHAERCDLCREEADFAASRLVEAPAAAAGPQAVFSRWSAWRWAWLSAAAAAAVVICAVVYPAYLGPRRYAHYAQLPDIPYEAIRAEFAAAHPDQLPQFRAATDLVSVGRYDEGARMLQALSHADSGDPSVVFFLGYVAVREGRWQEALSLCAAAEHAYLDGYRCWYLANVALIAGDLAVARRELRHAQGHALYRPQVLRLEKIVN